jgi:lysophospholipase L1-like esterase
MVANSWGAVVKSAGWGCSVSGVAEGAGNTYCDTGHPFKTSGTLSRVRISFNSPTGILPNTVKIKILRGESLCVVGSVDITSSVRAIATSGNFIYDSNLHSPLLLDEFSGQVIPVESGDVLSIYTDNLNFIAINTGVNGLKTGTGDTQNLMPKTGTYSLLFNAFVDCNNYIFYENDGHHLNGTSLQIPYCVNEKQYIAFEDVICPDNEDLQIKFKYVNPSGGSLTAFTINLSFDGNGIDDNRIALHSGDTFSNVNSHSILGQENDNFNIYIYNDPSDGSLMMTFVNMLYGQGKVGPYDIKFTTIPNRTTIGLTCSASYPPQRITIQNNGNNASVGKITVCRKPILMISDSFGSTKQSWFSPTKLTRVGSVLGKSFTPERYVINAGIVSASVNRTNTASTKIIERWDRTEDRQDLCALPSVLVVLLNGPGINDIASTSVDLTPGITASLMKIVADAQTNTKSLGFTNEVIMSELIPYKTGTDAQQKFVRNLNAQIRVVAAMLQVPMAQTYNGFDSENWYEDAGTHPNAEGAVYIANKIAQAYEDNLVPPQINIIKAGDCSELAPGDLNGDCSVNLQDFSLMATDWMARYKNDSNN